MAQILTQSPDPHPRTPSLVVPPGACDCHFHLFGPATQYAFDPESPYVSADMLPETFFQLQAKIGFQRGILISGGGYGRDTSHLTNTLKRFPDRLRGIAWPSDSLDGSETQRLNALGVRGIRFISEKRRGGLPTIAPDIAKMVYDNAGWQVHFYPNGDLVEQSQKLLALPNTLVLDHFGSINAAAGTNQADFLCLLEMLETGRVWVKLSGPMRCTPQDFPYPDLTPFAKALVQNFSHRLIWGSDWPHVNMNNRAMPNDGDLVDLISEWIPDRVHQRQILVDNPENLFGFSKKEPDAESP